MMSSNYT